MLKRSKPRSPKNVLKDKCEDLEVNCKCDKLCNTRMDYNYKQRAYKISAPEHFKNYYFDSIILLQKTQLALADYNALNYGQNQQCTKEREIAKKLTTLQLKHAQQIVGLCLYCCSVAETLSLVALSTIASDQAEWDELAIKVANMFLDCLATFPSRIITYEKSDMVLWTHNYGTYLVNKNANSRVDGNYFLNYSVKDL